MHHERGPERATPLSHGLFRMVEVHPPHKPGIRRPHNLDLDLVVFDMDGTLVEGSSWEMVHAHFGVSNHKNWEAYCRNEIDDLEFIRSDIALWVGNGRKLHVSDIERVFHNTHPFPGVTDLVKRLHEHGVSTMIMSGGLDILARRVCELTGIQRYVANGIHLTEEGLLTGDGYCLVKINDKGLATAEALKQLGVNPARVAAVGNTKFDIPMFKQCGFAAAFMPLDEEVVAAANATVRDPDMRHLWPHLQAYRAPGARAEQ
ncbi:MAG TPA: HAD family phosphatase [Candidatus Thermoplasmatota archaeon]|nr:HAD family phosphatase [Candidatus Thermoplasmatota archaeon]